MVYVPGQNYGMHNGHHLAPIATVRIRIICKHSNVHSYTEYANVTAIYIQLLLKVVFGKLITKINLYPNALWKCLCHVIGRFHGHLQSYWVNDRLKAIMEIMNNCFEYLHNPFNKDFFQEM